MAKKKSNNINVVTFADEARAIDKKYKDRELNSIQKESFNFEMAKLKAKNEVMKMQYENTEKMRQAVQQGNNAIHARGVMAKGGTLPKYYIGNYLTEGVDDPFGNIIPAIDSSLEGYVPSVNQDRKAEDIIPMVYPTNATTTTTKKEETPFNYNHLAMALKSGQLFSSFKNAVTPALNENAILPDYSQSDAKFNSMSYDPTNAINTVTRANNVQVGQINDNTISDATRQARLAGNNSNVNNQLAGIQANTNQQRNQILGQQGQYEASKANAIAAGMNQNRVNNLQNQANKSLAEQTFTENLSKLGTEANKYQYFQDAVKNSKDIAALTGSQGFNYLNSLSSTFQIGGQKEYLAYVQNPTEENRVALDKAMKLALTKQEKAAANPVGNLTTAQRIDAANAAKAAATTTVVNPKTGVATVTAPNLVSSASVNSVPTIGVPAVNNTTPTATVPAATTANTVPNTKITPAVTPKVDTTVPKADDILPLPEVKKEVPASDYKIPNIADFKPGVYPHEEIGKAMSERSKYPINSPEWDKINDFIIRVSHDRIGDGNVNDMIKGPLDPLLKLGDKNISTPIFDSKLTIPKVDIKIPDKTTTQNNLPKVTKKEVKEAFDKPKEVKQGNPAKQTFESRTDDFINVINGKTSDYNNISEEQAKGKLTEMKKQAEDAMKFGKKADIERYTPVVKKINEALGIKEETPKVSETATKIGEATKSGNKGKKN